MFMRALGLFGWVSQDSIVVTLRFFDQEDRELNSFVSEPCENTKQFEAVYKQICDSITNEKARYPFLSFKINFSGRINYAATDETFNSTDACHTFLQYSLLIAADETNPDYKATILFLRNHGLIDNDFNPEINRETQNMIRKKLLELPDVCSRIMTIADMYPADYYQSHGGMPEGWKQDILREIREGIPDLKTNHAVKFGFVIC